MWKFDDYLENTALVDEYGNKVTYSELTDISNRVFDSIGKRCLVVCLCENSLGSIIGYVSFMKHKIVPMLLSANLGEELLRGLLTLYSPEYLWVPQRMSDSFPEMLKCFEGYGYCLLETSYKNSYELFSELALLLTTSGSTGSPKFVRQSYKNITANTRSIVEYLHLNANERAITTLPMNYTYGLSIINTHLAVGATVLVTEKGLMQKEFWDFFKNQKATSFGGVPYTYEMLNKLRFFKMDIPSLKTMTQAGGKLLPELHEKFAAFANDTRRRFVVMYGQCEATARMGYLPPEHALEKKGSMGVAIPGGTFHIVDVEGNEIKEPFCTGELVYEGDNVTLGYAECGNDLKKGDERNGVLFTGDMAQFDEDGFFYIVGRKKRFLKIFGNRVNLDEMERMLKAKFNEEIACGGVDDSMAIYITDSGIAEDVRAYAAEKTNLHPSAFNVRVINEIPKTDSGKIKYSALEKYYGEEREQNE
ncbi:MAG: AMP-binding protein [Lachnospiraceae bacterium]|nr:AMP-binding protein [Lachnospiraceae bacterium]